MMLVSRESATGGRYSSLGSRSASIFPIDENHSDMVKFQKGDSNGQCFSYDDNATEIPPHLELRSQTPRLV